MKSVIGKRGRTNLIHVQPLSFIGLRPRPPPLQITCPLPLSTALLLQPQHGHCHHFISKRLISFKYPITFSRMYETKKMCPVLPFFYEKQTKIRRFLRVQHIIAKRRITVPTNLIPHHPRIWNNL